MRLQRENTIENFITSLAVAIGASAVILAATTWFISYVVTPVLIGRSWIPISPLLHWASLLAGTTLLGYGSLPSLRLHMKKIDRKYAALMIYKIVKWLFVIVFKACWFVVTTAFFAWIGQRPSNRGIESPQQATADDIWDSHPKHYYDNEPPKPFS